MSEALGCGINDFLCCPFSESEFIVRLNGVLPRHTDAYSLSRGREVREEYQLTTLIGESGPLLEIVAKLPCMAASDANCLLSGESGTGKELFARAIHYMSVRRSKPFVAVNCGALPDHLLENELFGHRRGAFTDASSSAEGLIAVANTGTLFLDEVDTLSLVAQAKLLRFIQEHEYRPLGSNQTITADIRVLAATNTDLRRRVEERLFREDLFYRLNVLHVHIPPLRDRAEDIPLLSQHFLQRYRSRYVREVAGLSTAAVHRLMGYSWPGNIRELEGIIHRAVILSSSRLIGPEDIELPAPAVVTNSEVSLRKAKESAMQSFERAYLTTLLLQHEGNVSRAAKAAGKERRAFQRLLKKYSVDRAQFVNVKIA
jgi:DNA-binding NtrC family response regulator